MRNHDFAKWLYRNNCFIGSTDKTKKMTHLCYDGGKLSVPEHLMNEFWEEYEKSINHLKYEPEKEHVCINNPSTGEVCPTWSTFGTNAAWRLCVRTAMAAAAATEAAEAAEHRGRIVETPQCPHQSHHRRRPSSLSCASSQACPHRPGPPPFQPKYA